MNVLEIGAVWHHI